MADKNSNLFKSR